MSAAAVVARRVAAAAVEARRVAAAMAMAMVADNLLILKALILQPILFSGQGIYSFR